MLAVSTVGLCQLKSVGEVPADLKRSMADLVETDLQRAESYAGEKVKPSKTKLIKEASYHVGKMMASGRIVYGDPVSLLAARIADTLLRDYPTLRAELRFYTVKSPEVNAFATGQGMIFINAGLMAQVEDEAQLAFIISHEIVHYFRNHVMEKLVGKKRPRAQETKNQKDDEATRRRDDEVKLFLRRHSRSREMENEADSLGIAMFYLDSPYDKGVTEGVFDVLQYGALPFDDVPFDTTWFNTPYYTLNGCWLDEVKPISSRDDYDDSRSTHPNILSRRKRCASILDGHSGGARFVVSTPEEFMQIRHLARLECIRQELVYGEYSRAFYNAWLLLKDHPDDSTLNRFLAQALYGIAMSKIHNGTNSVTGDYNQIEGESQQVYYAMRQMSEKEAALGALHTLWQQHRKFPTEAIYADMCGDLMDAIHNELKMNQSDFLSTNQRDSETTVQQDTNASSKDKPLTKYERIKQKRQSQANNSPLAYALTDLLMSDTAFAAELAKRTTGQRINESAPAVPSLGGVVEDRGGQQPSSKVIVYSPSYWVVDDRRDQIIVESSVRKEHDLTRQIFKLGNRMGMENIDFSDESLHQMTTAQQYNDFVVLNEWINEFWQNKGQFRIRRLLQPEMDDLMDRYGSSTINMTAVLNTEHLYSTPTGYLVLLPLAPVSLYRKFTRTQQTAMESLVVDAREGKVLSRETYSYNLEDHNALVDAMLYDSYKKAMGSGTQGKKTVGASGLRCAIEGGANLAFSGCQTFDIGQIVSITPWANVEFALSPKLSLSAGWAYQWGFEELNKETPDLSKNMTTWSLALRFYKNTDFAPMGPYVGGGLHMVHFSNMSDGSDGGNVFGFHFGAGRNYVFYNRMVFNIEARYSYTYGLLDAAKTIGGGDFGGRKHVGDAFMANLLMFRIGIGILPF